MPKATYMYWQKRFDRGNPDREIEKKILEIREEHKDYGYRRILGELRNQLEIHERSAANASHGSYDRKQVTEEKEHYEIRDQRWNIPRRHMRTRQW